MSLNCKLKDQWYTTVKLLDWLKHGHRNAGKVCSKRSLYSSLVGKSTLNGSLAVSYKATHTLTI